MPKPLQSKYRCFVHRCPYPYLLGSKALAGVFWEGFFFKYTIFHGQIFDQKHFSWKSTGFYKAAFCWKQLSISGWKFFAEKGNTPFFWTLRCAAASKHRWLLCSGCIQKSCIPLERDRVVWDVDAEMLVECLVEIAHMNTSCAFEMWSSASVNTKRNTFHPVLMGKQTVK